MKFGQLFTASVPGFIPGTMPAGPPAGTVFSPVQQPIGNWPALNFLAATAWSTGDAPHRPTLPGMPWPGAQPQTCRPLPHDFYNQYPGALPAGPLDPWDDPWPTNAKPAPGGPLLHDGAGGFAVPTPGLPDQVRGVAQNDSAQLTPAMTAAEARDRFFGGALGATGAAVAIGLLMWAGMRRGR